MRYTRSGDAVEQPLAQQADRTAGRHAALAFVVGDAGDVEVRPALAFGEAREEAARGDRARPAAADVVDVGEAGLQQRLVFVPQRQAPGAVEYVFARGGEFGGEVVVLRHQAGRVLAQRDHAGAGERGDI